MTFHTSCPVVRRSTEEFSQWVVIGGDRRKAIFEKAIVWLLESESVVQFLHGGELLTEGRHSNDFYGLLSSTDASAAGLGLVQLAQRYGITQESSLILVVETRVFERPAVEPAETIAKNKQQPKGYKLAYAQVPDDWRQERIVDGETTWPRLEQVEIASGVVWTSRNDEESNARLCADFVAQWRRPALDQVAGGGASWAPAPGTCAG
jgi:hypothetical protein